MNLTVCKRPAKLKQAGKGQAAGGGNIMKFSAGEDDLMNA